VKLLETLPALAFSVTCSAVATDETVAMNAALVALAGIETAAGTVTAELLLDRLMLCPLLGAGDASFAVQESVPDPVMDALLQESVLKATADEVDVAAEASLSCPPNPNRQSMVRTESTTREENRWPTCGVRDKEGQRDEDEIWNMVTSSSIRGVTHLVHHSHL
jgi:hypothetical protein